MSDYIRREDAVDRMNSYGSIWMEYTEAMSKHEVAEQALKASKQAVIDVLENLPSASVAPVVRCKDCKHYYFADNRIPQEQRYVCEISGEIWKPDSFCSYGEREE